MCGVDTARRSGGGSTGGGSTGGGSTGGGSTGGGSTGGGSAAGSAVTVSLGGPIIPAAPVLQAGTTKTAIIASNSAKLFSVKVLQSKLGRYLVVNVKGTAKTANVRIQIMGKNGKVLKTIVRTVPTNRAFKIANFKLAKTAVVRQGKRAGGVTEHRNMMERLGARIAGPESFLGSIA